MTRSLARPPQVRCFGELAKFNFASEPNAFAPFVRLTGREEAELKELQFTDIAGFIFDLVYALPGNAVGFKLFYEHCREGDREKLWERLALEDEVKVVHLTRNATFDLYLSLLYAQRTGKWLMKHDEAEAAPNDADDIEVDVEHCRAFLQTHLNWRREAKARFAAHPYLEVDYSDLENDLVGVLTNVRGFIGAPELTDQMPPLKKQATRQAADKVLNFKAIKNAFADTELAPMFPFG